MGIQKMLGFPTDTWHANKSLIDFDFINQHYELAIIGGAGLLHGAYEGFWDVVHEKCEIPIVVWGVGGCYPDDDDSPAVPPSVASPVLQNAAWVNLRDTYTADFYDVPKATISACPTVVYLDDSWAKDAKRSKNLLLSTHTGLVDSQERSIIEQKARSAAQNLNLNFIHTDNIQIRTFGLYDIIEKGYQRSALVLTTRLHGAIIAYSLCVPYVAIARDEKVRAFCQEYGNGLCVEDTAEIENAAQNYRAIESSAVARDEVLEFGQAVKNWINNNFSLQLDR